MLNCDAHMRRKGLLHDASTPVLVVAMTCTLAAKSSVMLQSYANANGISIVGDMPIYVGGQSADVWANRHLFELGPDGAPLFVSGVPPDLFSATGQLWGSPLFDWKVYAASFPPAHNHMVSFSSSLHNVTCERMQQLVSHTWLAFASFCRRFDLALACSCLSP